MRVWRADTREPLATVHVSRHALWGLDWSADGTRIAAGSGGGSVHVLSLS